MASIAGANANTLVKPSDKFRVTFGLQQFPLVGGSLYDASQIAQLLLDTLPRAGFVPVSNPAATSSARVVVLDVRLSATWSGNWSGKTVADVVTALERLGQNAASWYDRLVLNDVSVLTVQALSLTLTSQQLQQGQTQAQQAGEALQQSLLDRLLGLLPRIATGAGVTVALVIVGGLAYVWYKRR